MNGLGNYCVLMFCYFELAVSNCGITIFIPHAITGIDTRIRFSLEPLPGDSAFDQWRDAMKAVARLPHGIPDSFRKKVCTSTMSLKLKKKNLNVDLNFS